MAEVAALPRVASALECHEPPELEAPMPKGRGWLSEGILFGR